MTERRDGEILPHPLTSIAGLLPDSLALIQVSDLIQDQFHSIEPTDPILQDERVVAFQNSLANYNFGDASLRRDFINTFRALRACMWHLPSTTTIGELRNMTDDEKSKVRGLGSRSQISLFLLNNFIRPPQI